MLSFTTPLLQFADQGEKTGWTYIQIPSKLAQQLKPGNKKTFRVKGKLDNYTIKGIALLPMGEGDFIMAINATMRKAIGKRKGASVKVQLVVDDTFSYKIPQELMECFDDEPAAKIFFEQLAKGHQGYFLKWLESAKTDATRTKRMAQMVNALARRQDFGTMVRSLKQERSDLSR